MTDASDTGRRKTPDRRLAERRDTAAAPPPDRRSLVVSGPAAHSAEKSEASGATAAFAAQLLGQPGIKRGLKGGPEVIDGACSAYLETEYLGSGERRIPKGVIAKREI